MDETKNDRNYRITKVTAVLMVSFTLMVDFIEIGLEWLVGGLFITWLIPFGVWPALWTWFQIKGVSFLSSWKKTLTFGGMGLVEIIPGLDATIILSFGWTIGVIATIFFARQEDKGGIIGKVANVVKMKKSVGKGKITPNNIPLDKAA